ncbi:MAG: pantetheine-phosphate adenylyltransferase, partial [Verrucomicrobiae bacterium]|nr:pantetheine-phosphate adenylyltransferase [Verrucomicrobiae bacterium]
AQERVALVEAAVRGLRRVEAEYFQGLLVEDARRKKAVAIIRGLRAVSDFEHELQFALMNRKLAPEVETIFLAPKDEYTFVSSRMIKEIARLGGNISCFVPKEVETALRRKFSP